jgi:hypothetical protein
MFAFRSLGSIPLDSFENIPVVEEQGESSTTKLNPTETPSKTGRDPAKTASLKASGATKKSSSTRPSKATKPAAATWTFPKNTLEDAIKMGPIYVLDLI